MDRSVILTVARIVEPVRNFVRVVIDIVPDDNIAVLERPVLKALIWMRSIGRIHPAGAVAVGELAERVSAEAGRRVDRAHVVAVLADRAQTSAAHGLGIKVIHSCVLLQRIRCCRNPGHVFGQIAVIRQVYILRSFQRTDETEVSVK